MVQEIIVGGDPKGVSTSISQSASVAVSMSYLTKRVSYPLRLSIPSEQMLL
jgi:hypothetical protein